MTTDDAQVRFPAIPRWATLDAVLAGMVAVLVLLLALDAFVPGFAMLIVAPRLDLVLETVTTAVAVAVATLAWIRHRQQAAPEALFRAAAFVVLAIANGLTVALVVSGLDAQAGMQISAPGQAPTYIFTASRFLAAALLIAGGIDALRDRRARWPGAIMAASAVAMLGVIALVEVRAGSLPPFEFTAIRGSLPASTLLGAGVQAVVSGLFFAAAALSLRLYHRSGSIGQACLAVGLVFGAFAQADGAIHPSTFTGVVTIGDLLRLAFDVSLLVGIQAEVGAILTGLRAANADLERLRTLDVQRAALEERAHLSRELHDGLAQNLWFAKLKAGRLAVLPDLGPEAGALVGDLGVAIDSGLAEAQQAVTALRVGGEPSGPMWDVIERYVADFADRFGLRAEVACPSGPSGLAPRAEAELLRIAQEALSNVRRHADATMVRVHATVDDGLMELVVGDNGRGFDPGAVGDGSYGLASMRERTALLGGELRIESRPQDGTRVHVLVPVPVFANPARVASR